MMINAIDIKNITEESRQIRIDGFEKLKKMLTATKKKRMKESSYSVLISCSENKLLKHISMCAA